MITLKDRLVELADEAPHPTGPDRDLWDRGVRIHRQRRLGTGAIAVTAAVLLAAVFAGSWLAAEPQIQPAAPGQELRLPDRFYSPSPWLPGTDDGGSLGPLVAIVGAERKGWTTGSANAIVGVSATTGEYRFLDLPGWPLYDPGLPGADFALSPDGSRLAYWYVGDEGHPRVDGVLRASGVAVYDAVTGETVRREIPTGAGLSGDALVWTGGRLWLDYYVYDNARTNFARRGNRYVWNLGDGSWTQAPDALELWGAREQDGLLVTHTERRLQVWDDTEVVRTIRLDGWIHGALLAPDGRRVLAWRDRMGRNVDSGDVVLLVGEVRRGQAVRLRELPDGEVGEAVGWRDSETVVVHRYGRGFHSVDLEAGDTGQISRPAPINWSPGTVVAQDAWTWPTYAAPEPPNTWDPRLVWGLVAGIVLAAGCALLVWRRRVGP